MNIFQTLILWLLLNIIIVVTMQFALFTQTTTGMKNEPMLLKLITSEFWATIEWIFVIPAQRIGYTFLNPAQLAMSSYVFDFLSQLWSNTFWLHLPTTPGDYVGMVLVLLGMFLAKFRVFG